MPSFPHRSVILHGEFSDFVGAAAHSAGTSEWTAIIWAVLWVIQAGFIVPVVIHADACVQFLCADGEQRWRSEPIKFLSRALVMTCRQTNNSLHSVTSNRTRVNRSMNLLTTMPICSRAANLTMFRPMFFSASASPQSACIALAVAIIQSGTRSPSLAADRRRQDDHYHTSHDTPAAINCSDQNCRPLELF